MFWPCETRTSTCRSFATISSGLYRFLAIAVLLDIKDIPQVGPLQWGWITDPREHNSSVDHVRGRSNRPRRFERPGMPDPIWHQEVSAEGTAAIPSVRGVYRRRFS